MEYVRWAGLQVAEPLAELVENVITPGTGISSLQFWKALQEIVQDLGPRNQALLDRRRELQDSINQWHLQRRDLEHPGQEYKKFLYDIGYLLPEGEDFTISTTGVDPEIASIAGPQLVVPVNNARYAVNACNARWGSLYDALYGTDVIPDMQGAQRGQGYNPVRGEMVVKSAAGFLDRAAPLEEGSYSQAVGFELQDSPRGKALMVRQQDNSTSGLANAEQFAGYAGEDRLESILLKNNGLHIEILIDPDDPVGGRHPAGVKDVVLESAVTTILDCEDSVAAVDPEDKTLVYSNLLGLFKGELETAFYKNDQLIKREMHPDRSYVSPDGQSFCLPGRSLMLVRTVGHLMTTDAVLDGQGGEIFEGILDTMITALAGMHDLQGQGRFGNSRSGSLYIVKPKMHGPEEVQFTCELFARVEDALGLPRNTLKVGVMDEERRTTLNLKECIRVARERIIFINTGFLDRTGDEIHTSMEAGAMVRKGDMKKEPWMLAYEDWNVDTGLACGFRGRAQIGKGMWPKPAEMREMVMDKLSHPMAGANCAWVPSPTAATLHATHYHQVNVDARQAELEGQRRAKLDDLLNVPVIKDKMPSSEEIRQELETNAQSILGYVVRWVEQGIGCSTVPDISDTGLMEDRATLRISSQHMANWLHHGLCTREEVLEVLRKMATVVDRQNAHDLMYRPMSRDFDSSPAFQAACDLVFEGRSQPSGYTEPILHSKRREAKSRFGV
ncbi:malate synthase G [Desulfonatronospira sp. MSAO_Bac3]|uniref:malate synthase G n=1 Tax=Desulfonatronospira sp. MSAO_Bac3 TaxID=2293857 RepID=UPI000FF3F0C7|nr:malate synthase G [Desulfonatronospira sp. MSAO_Bac3]RQD73094.1 MAG: malate synthase G [Desulfonatronospira sp. MSAO_Bac3]